MPAGPLLAWKRGDIRGVAERLTFAAAVALVCAGLFLWLADGGPLIAGAILFIALYAITGALVEFAERLQLFRVPLRDSFLRARGLPRSAFGTVIAHVGIGLSLLGIVGEAGWSQERIVALKPGDRVSISSFNLSFTGLTERRDKNWRDRVGHFEVRRGGVLLAVIEPAKRVFTANNRPTTEAGIGTFGLGQLYISLGDPALEARARELSKSLRCMVCQNQSIDDSAAPLAHDIRVLVRERIKAGDSDREIQDFLVARYGEFVLLEPRLNAHTILLWAVPGLVLVAGAAAIFLMRIRRVQPRLVALSREEEKRLAKLTGTSNDLTNL
jgi:cytochrome c-type biogenesis protein CcmH/NrfF